MMAVQLPEPEYYTLAEVAKRWEVSEDMLLRLGAEEKLLFAWPVSSGFRIYDNLGECLCTVEEVEQLFPSLRPGQLFFRFPKNGAIEILMGGLAYLHRYSLLHLSPLTDGLILHPGFSRVSHFINNEEGEDYMTALGGLPPLAAPYHFRSCVPVHTSELVIPTTEIHRIEHQREAAEKAADDDVLGTKEKETMQAVIAAMTQFIASTTQKYKHGGHPNVDAIAGALEEAIPDRTKRGVSETISRALKAGLIRT